MWEKKSQYKAQKHSLLFIYRAPEARAILVLIQEATRTLKISTKWNGPESQSSHRMSTHTPLQPLGPSLMLTLRDDKPRTLVV